MSILFENFSFRCKETSGGIYYDRWADDSLTRFKMQDKLYFLDKILNTILLHETIYLRLDSLEEFIEILGLDQTIKLLDRKILQVIDYWYFPAFMIVGDNTLSFMNMELSNMHPRILKRLSHSYSHTKLSYISNYLKDGIMHDDISYSYWDSLARNEIYDDMQNDLLRAHLKLTSPNPHDVTEEDSFCITRLFLMERSFEWARNLKTDVVLLEDRAKYWLSLKAGRTIDRTTIGDINKILSAKKIWNLSLLYYNGVINIDDILDVRENVNGIKFREWIASKDYSADELEKILMSHKIADPQKEWLKWGVLSAIGAINTVAGIAVSLVDQIKGSYKEWNPELFFDVTLSKKFSGRKIDNALLKRK